MTGPIARRFPPVKTRRFTVRVLEEKDVTQVYASWFQNPEVARFIVAARRSQTVKSLRNYVRGKQTSDQSLLLGIFTRHTQRHIGNIKFEPIYRADKATVLGVMIGDSGWRGRGVFREVFTACAHRMESVLGIDTFALGVDNANRRAIRAYIRAGFTLCEQSPPSIIRHPRRGCSYLVYRATSASSK